MKCCASRLKIFPGLLVLVATFGAGYLAAWYFGPPAAPTVVVSASGLKYIDLVEGQGATPKLGQTIVVNYTGWLENGKELQIMRSLGSPSEFVLGPGLIPGWNEALQTMKVGGKRRITLPPHLAYGEAGNFSNIPPYATLIFEVELLGVR
jgi:peptidylprolyl isomerase